MKDHEALAKSEAPQWTALVRNVRMLTLRGTATLRIEGESKTGEGEILASSTMLGSVPSLRECLFQALLPILTNRSEFRNQEDSDKEYSNKLLAWAHIGMHAHDAANAALRRLHILASASDGTEAKARRNKGQQFEQGATEFRGRVKRPRA